MKSEYDFSKARRAKDIPHLSTLQEQAGGGKTRITIMLDDDVIEGFKALVGPAGAYQTEINRVLRAHLSASAPVTASEMFAALEKLAKTMQKAVRDTVRKELHTN
ncbi:BrnA antitoxin family protein [Dyella jejuensis]|uniref:BrnA antitoxin family protein n=1 Tax=Dyella jejuensis TaxID=1432009 RepID=A0ABW8JF35_9GAMM